MTSDNVETMLESLLVANADEFINISKILFIDFLRKYFYLSA